MASFKFHTNPFSSPVGQRIGKMTILGYLVTIFSLDWFKPGLYYVLEYLNPCKKTHPFFVTVCNVQQTLPYYYMTSWESGCTVYCPCSKPSFPFSCVCVHQRLLLTSPHAHQWSGWDWACICAASRPLLVLWHWWWVTCNAYQISLKTTGINNSVLRTCSKAIWLHQVGNIHEILILVLKTIIKKCAKTKYQVWLLLFSPLSSDHTLQT